MAMFQAELRSAVREARAQPAARPRSAPAVEQPTKRTTIRLWLPLTPLWIVLAPFALLLAPLVTYLPPLLPPNRRRPALRAALVAHPFRTAFALGGALLALSGTVVSVTNRDVLIRIRIF
jgi:hypothetical protein